MSAMHRDPYGLEIGATCMVPIADIARRGAWQVRQALTGTAVKRYAAAYKTGGGMAPVRLARIGDGLVLIDGAHRIAARQGLGLRDVEAVVEALSEKQAQWESASANLSHGEPLKHKELRAVFGHYVETEQHRVGRSKVKSLREIVGEIPGVASHVSIGKWMREDFPEVYAKHYAYKGSGTFAVPEKGTPKPSQRSLDLETINTYFRQVQALAKTFPSQADKRQVVRWGMAMLEEIVS